MPEFTDDQIKKMLDDAKAEVKAEVEKEKDSQLAGLRRSSEDEIKKAKAAAESAKEATRKEMLQKLGLEADEQADGKLGNYAKLQAELQATKKATEELNAKVASEQTERKAAQTRAQMLESGVDKGKLDDALDLFRAKTTAEPDTKLEDFLKAKPWLLESSSKEQEQKPNALRIFSSGGKGAAPKHTIDLDKALEEGRRNPNYSG